MTEQTTPTGTPETTVATTDATAAVGEDLLQLVTFGVGDEEYAVPILSVQEINRMMEITRVPQSPPFVEGVINLRGKIIPVVDLRKKFGMANTEQTKDHRIIVVEVQNRVIGFTVDRVSEVLRISRDVVDTAPQMVTGVDIDYVDGVGKLDDRLLILLSLTRLFAMDEIDSVVEAASA
jgi:purine-binding chemotaxis protein CheW